jgi:hypothetical protein
MGSACMLGLTSALASRTGTPPPFVVAAAATQRVRGRVLRCCGVAIARACAGSTAVGGAWDAGPPATHRCTAHESAWQDGVC